MKDATTPIQLHLTSKKELNRFCKFCLSTRLNFSIEALIKRTFIGKVHMTTKHQEAFNALFNPADYGLQ